MSNPVKFLGTCVVLTMLSIRALPKKSSYLVSEVIQKRESDDPLDIAISTFECNSCPEVESLINKDEPLAFISGAMKGGTRALLTYLGEHPKAYPYQGRESNVLKTTKTQGNTTIDRCQILRSYQEEFEEKRHHKKNRHINGPTVFFDKSPNYMTEPEIPQRMLCAVPNAKVIFVLRNPTDRTFSHYQHNVRQGRVKDGETFEMKALHEIEQLVGRPDMTREEEAIQFERIFKNTFLRKSLYVARLRRWLAVFRNHFGESFMDHILIIESESFRHSKQQVYDRVLDFVGLPPFQLEDSEPKHVGGYKEEMSQETREALNEFFRPYNARLHDLLAPLGIEISWAKEAAESYA